MGIGSRLAYMKLPASYSWVPYAGAILYGFTTPIGIAVGLGVRTLYNPGSTTASIVSGTLDSLSSGILVYTGLVEVRYYPIHRDSKKLMASLKTFSSWHMNFYSTRKWYKDRIAKWHSPLDQWPLDVVSWPFLGDGHNTCQTRIDAMSLISCYVPYLITGFRSPFFYRWCSGNINFRRDRVTWSERRVICISIHCHMNISH